MYTVMRYPMPICRPKEFTDCNLGWCKGVLDDGVPFVAEIWEKNGDAGAAFYLPFQERLFPEGWIGVVYNPPQGEDSYEEFCTAGDESCLLEGMEQLDNCSALLHDVIIPHVNYLKENGLVSFTGETENGGLQVLWDMAGNPIVAVHISISWGYELEAETPLEFEGFNKWKECDVCA